MSARRAMTLADLRALPMELSIEKIAHCVRAVIHLDPPPAEGAELLGDLADRQQMHWQPFDAATRATIDSWLDARWSDERAFIDAAATLIVSLGLERGLKRLEETAQDASDPLVRRLAREALDEV